MSIPRLHRCNIRSTNVLKVMNPTWHHIFNLIFILVEMETNVNDPSSSIVQSSVQLNVWWPFSPRVMVENGPSGCPLVKPLSCLSALNMTNTLTRFVLLRLLVGLKLTTWICNKIYCEYPSPTRIFINFGITTIILH